MNATDGAPDTALRLSSATVSRIERAASGAATRAVAQMDERLPWFRVLPAAQRSSVTLVAQAGISGYVDWLTSGERSGADGLRMAGSIFGNAPRELVRWVSLRRTVELVRVAIEVAEQLFPALAGSPGEQVEVTLSLLRYSREVAFSAAAIYAAAAESRGAWDQRLEAMVVDALVRGENDDSLASRAAALNWDLGRPVVILVGDPPETETRDPRGVSGVSAVNAVGAAGAAGAVGGVSAAGAVGGVGAVGGGLGSNPDRWSIQGQHRGLLIVVLNAADPAELETSIQEHLTRFGHGPVVRGPIGVGLHGAIRSARDALSGIQAIAAWPQAPRGVPSSALLPERVLAKDSNAVDELITSAYLPLVAAGDPLLRTLDAYLLRGGALEPTARDLYVHVNTVRYRLRRVTELTGLDPWQPRDALALRMALAHGRLASADPSG